MPSEIKPEITLEKIYRSALKFLVRLTPEETYSIIVREAMKLVEGDEGVIILKEDDYLKVAYASSAQAANINVRKRGFTYRALTRQEAFIVHHNDIARIHPNIAKRNVRSVIFMPLSYQKTVIGVLIVRSFKENHFSLRDLNVIRLLGSMASLSIRKTQAYADATKALETRDLFIAMASHELKTPLTTISVYAQLITKTLAQEEMPKLKWAQSLLMETIRLSHLVNELLQLHQIEKGSLRYIVKNADVKEIVSRAVIDFKATHPDRKVSVVDKTKKETYVISGDFDKLLQVLINLLNNAAKFSSSSTIIKVTISCKNSSCTLAVIDKGQGISKADLPHVFDQFYKGKTGGKEGMGLGLFLSKSIIENHGGKIEVISKEGIGTTFTITLPLAD